MALQDIVNRLQATTQITSTSKVDPDRLKVVQACMKAFGSKANGVKYTPDVSENGYHSVIAVFPKDRSIELDASVLKDLHAWARKYEFGVYLTPSPVQGSFALLFESPDEYQDED